MAQLRLTARGTSNAVPLETVGPYGAYSDLAWITRWGSGASGMFEATWTMPLPPHFDHPLLRRGTLVELCEGPWRIGSPLILSEPERGTGYDDPWSFTATGVGREAEGDNSFYALDGTGTATSVLQTAVDQAIARGLPWTGRDSTIFAGAFGANPPDSIYTVGSLLTAAADYLGQRWGVWESGAVGFKADPTVPTWHTTPNVAALGVSDDDYATVVYFTYTNSATNASATVVSPSVASATQTAFGRSEYLATAPDGLGAIPTATAQAIADGILAKSKGRLGWTDGLTVTSQELLSVGGVPADLSLVQAGQMVRLHGVFNDLIAYNGTTWLDVIIGEAKYADGATTIDLNPLGLAARDLASVVEEVTGMASAA